MTTPSLIATRSMRRTFRLEWLRLIGALPALGVGLSYALARELLTHRGAEVAPANDA
ncbi:hypothetical protein [Allochromatium tepidum]|uniref:Uncharacterized protein n=1 Tax=Allochromatium tepidum TaxID=553982 RepID=A0ABM7QME5_9GAMM|nr:hypothetical protein [Allochromatium tepidum]BCU07104.1 hypothetical protein Atep_17810 [Allochromatium tepidum]